MGPHQTHTQSHTRPPSHEGSPDLVAVSVGALDRAACTALLLLLMLWFHQLLHASLLLPFLWTLQRCK